MAFGCSAGKIYRGIELKKQNQNQRRLYAVKSNVDKVILTPGRPIGRVGFHFSKDGIRMRQAHSEGILKYMNTISDAATTKFTEEQYHKKLEGLLCLETAVKLIEKPDLLKREAQPGVVKDAEIHAVAWLRGISLLSEAKEMAAELGEENQMLLKHEISLTQILIVDSSIGLRLPLEMTASVKTWWVAYMAALRLQNDRRLFSTLTGLPFSREKEEGMHQLALIGITKRINRYVQGMIAKSADALFPEALKEANSPEYQPLLYRNRQTTLKQIDQEVDIIKKLKSIPMNQWTAGEVTNSMIVVRNHIREICLSLLDVAGRCYEDSVDSSIIDNWNIINEAHAKNYGDQVKAAIEQLEAIKLSTPPSDLQMIELAFPDEMQALNSALQTYSELAESIPEDLISDQFMRRAIDLSHSPDPELFELGRVDAC